MKKYIVILLLAFSGSAFAESYLCIADKATGFAFQDGDWVSNEFNVGDEKYILRERSNKEMEQAREVVETLKEVFEEIEAEDLGLATNEPVDYLLNSTHVVLQHGFDDVPLYLCRYVSITGSFKCNGIKGKFLFSTKSGRFTMTHLAGYWRGKDNDQTPIMYIGRCSKI